MDTEEQHWIQKNNIQIQRDNIGYRRTISDTEEQYLYTKERYWLQRDNNIGYRRTLSRYRGTLLDTEEQYRLQITSNYILKDFGYRRIIFKYRWTISWYKAVTEDQYLNTDRQNKELWIYIIRWIKCWQKNVINIWKNIFFHSDKCLMLKKV